MEHPSNTSTQLSLSEVHNRQAIYGFQLSPNGQQFCLTLQRDRRDDEIIEGSIRKIKTSILSDLYVMPAKGGYLRPITDTSDVNSPAVWSPDGTWLAFVDKDGLKIMPAIGGEKQNIYKGKLYTPPLEQGDAFYGCPRWSPDGESLLFATNESPITTLHLVSKNGRQQRELHSTEGYILTWDWSPDSRHVVIVSRSENGWVGDIRLIDIDADQFRVLCNEENYEYQKPVAGWSPDGQLIVFRSNRTGWSKLWTIVPDSATPRLLIPGDFDDYSFRFSQDGKLLVYASCAEQDGISNDLWITPLPAGKPNRLTHFKGINVPLAWSQDNRIYFWHSSPTEPGDLWVISANGGEPERLTWSSPIEIERKLRAPEEVVITNEDGTKIPSLIYLPVFYQKDEQYPAIVWIHGGPASVSRFDFTPLYNWLANQGFVVIVPNFRGSTGFGVPYMSLVTGEGLGKNDLSDVLAAGMYAQTLPYVNLDRGVGVGGRSWGGYLSLMAITQAPELFSCAVAGAAISDWRIQQSQTEVRYYDRWLIGGWVYEQEQRVRERSPINFVDRIRVPLLIYHGAEDRDVPFPQFQSFIERAKHAGVEIECVTYLAEGHSNKIPGNQQDTLDRIQVFYRRNLQPWNLRDNPSGNQVQY